MPDRVRRLLPILAILAVALVVWLPTLGWGLPTRAYDKYLFGDRRPWTGAEIAALTATTQPATAVRGADVDADPILDRSKPVVLNDTDAKRAAIVRRYRLMSGQPDEFIQFKALSEMAARRGLAKLDPRLYQYGGLWMYPVGTLVRSAMLVGTIPTPPPGVPAIEFYLDHPEAFGRFYVVARLYSWCWGVVAALAIFWLARRVTGHRGYATLAVIAFMLLPVVRTATHEAKPHLAGAALCLCAVIAATRYVETGRRRWLVGAGALCGAAMAMVVSMLLSCAVLPTMAWLRWRAEKRLPLPRAGGEGGGEGDEALSSQAPIEQRATDAPSTVRADSGRPLTPTLSPYAGEREPSFVRSLVVPLFVACSVAASVYVMTNPFVLINAVAHPEILRSNLGNSTAMYSPRSDGIHAVTSAYRIAMAAVTPVCFWIASVLAVGGVISSSSCRKKTACVTSILLLAPAALVLAQFVALAAGKPAEYARFGLTFVAFTSVAAVVGLRRLAAAFYLSDVLALLLVLFCAAAGFGTELDWLKQIGRLVQIGTIERVVEQRRLMGQGIFRVGTLYEPAPWSAPALNLFKSTVTLIPRGKPATDVDLVVWPKNLNTQVGRGTPSGESVDWYHNNFGTDWSAASSGSGPAGYRSAE